MSCANNVLPVYMWPSPEKIPEGLCLRPVQVDTVHFSPEATETNGFSCVSSSLNRTAVFNSVKVALHLIRSNSRPTAPANAQFADVGHQPQRKIVDELGRLPRTHGAYGEHVGPRPTT